MARQVTIKAFEAWIADEANVVDVLDRISGGLTLQKTSRAVKQPYTCLHGWFHATPEREARYLAARKAWADAVMDESMELADGAAEDRDAVAKVKLQVDVRQNQAKAYHRERWGEVVKLDAPRDPAVDAALLGTASELLRLARERRRPEITVLENEAELLPAPKR